MQSRVQSIRGEFLSTSLFSRTPMGGECPLDSKCTTGSLKMVLPIRLRSSGAWVEQHIYQDPGERGGGKSFEISRCSNQFPKTCAALRNAWDRSGLRLLRVSIS